MSRTRRSKLHWATVPKLLKPERYEYLRTEQREEREQQELEALKRDRWLHGFDRHHSTSHVSVTATVAGRVVRRGWQENDGRWAKRCGNKRARQKLLHELRREVTEGEGL